MRNLCLGLFLILPAHGINAQSITFEGKEFEIVNVHASVVPFEGREVLKVERDLSKIPFDTKNLQNTVDEPTFVKLSNNDFENGTIEIKFYSQIQNPSPFQSAQGFIGLAYRIAADNSAFESIYLRPKVGRSENQLFRNKTVQYFSYPNHKFETLRKTAGDKYETSAPVDINEWITMRIEVKGERAEMFINNTPYSTFIVDKMLGNLKKGSIGLWVDIGTVGYFKDLKITNK